MMLGTNLLPLDVCFGHCCYIATPPSFVNKQDLGYGPAYH